MLGAPRVCICNHCEGSSWIWSLLSDIELICTKGVQIGVGALSRGLFDLEVRHYGIFGE